MKQREKSVDILSGVFWTVQPPMGLIKGAKNSATAKKFLDWAAGPGMQRIYEEKKINLIPTHPEVRTANPALDMKDVHLLDLDIEWSGENRKRLVERWVKEILH